MWYEIDKLITFSRLSNKKLRAGVFVGPDIRKLFSNSQFFGTLSGNERQSFDQLMVVVPKVLVPSDINPERKIVMVDNMINYFISVRGTYSPKMHYIHKHPPELLENQCWACPSNYEINWRKIFKKKTFSEYTWRECTWFKCLF